MSALHDPSERFNGPNRLWMRRPYTYTLVKLLGVEISISFCASANCFQYLHMWSISCCHSSQLPTLVDKGKESKGHHLHKQSTGSQALYSDHQILYNGGISCDPHHAFK